MAGEGLIGQIFLEKQKMIIDQLPEDYSQIVSGLGETKPTYMLIIPLKNNEKVEGIMELASLKALEGHHLEFLDRISENIAITLHNQKSAAKTQNLLMETQEQAEQLRAQEEELRQNMEELQATQEAMRIKQEEIERSNINALEAKEELLQTLEDTKQKEEELLSTIQKMNEIQQTLQSKEKELQNFVNVIDNHMFWVEMDGNGNFLNANKNFLQAIGYELDELTALHHSALTSETYKYSEEYKQFWTNLRKGIPSVGEFERIGKNAQVFWLKGSYTPVMDDKNKAVKVIKIAQDITTIKVQACFQEENTLAV